MNIKPYAAVLGVLFIVGPYSQAVSRLEKGEKLLFFTDYAWLSPDGTYWTALVHGWDYKPELDSKRRKWLINELGRTFHLSKDDAATADFDRRARWFFVHNQGGRTFQAKIAGRAVPLKRSLSSGHIHDQITIPHNPGDSSENSWSRVRLDLLDANGDPVFIPVRRLGSEGLIIVSDIDDTVKVSGVGNHKELLANTFVKPYEAVEGMPALYQHWAAQNAQTAFIYLSASPWPLYPELSDFLKKAGFPRGVLKLKHFRWRDQSFFSLWENSMKYKTPILEELFTRFPKRSFILVGDTGDKDLEIYGALARRHPNQIDNIYIRELADVPAARYQKAFSGLDPIHLHTFRTVRDLGFGQ